MAELEPLQTISPASDAAGHGLRRQLRLADLVLAQIVNVVGSSWVGVAAGLGHAQTLMWMGAMAVFYLPMAAAVIGLNRAMPLEGGLYVWARRAFGDLAGFLTAWNLWIYSIAVTAVILYAIPTEFAYLIGPRAQWLPQNPWASFAVVALFTAAIMWVSVRGLALGKWIQNVGGSAMLIVFAILIALPLWAVIHSGSHAFAGTAGWSVALKTPAVNLRTMSLFGQMLFGALCGLEYIAIFAGESEDPGRRIGQSVWIASPLICAMFILGTTAVVAFVPAGKIDFIAPIPQTLRIALGNNGMGNVVAMTAIILVEVRLLGATWMLFNGAARLPMAVGWDELLPAWFTRLDARFKTPVNSIWCVGVLVLGMVALASVGVHAQETNQLLSNASLTHYELTYLAMFAAPVAGAYWLRRQSPWWLKAACITGFAATLFSLAISVFPYIDVADPAAYAAKIGGTVVLSNLVATAYFFSRRKRGQG